MAGGKKNKKSADPPADEAEVTTEEAVEEPPRIQINTLGGDGEVWGHDCVVGGDAAGEWPAVQFDDNNGEEITYVIPCKSCAAFLSLTKSTQGDQVCQACQTPVQESMQQLHNGKEGMETLITSLPAQSQRNLIKASCPSSTCGRVSIFPRFFAIYCPVCLKEVLREKRAPVQDQCELYCGTKGVWARNKIQEICVYFGEKPNPVFQLIYLGIMASWFYIYITFGWIQADLVRPPLHTRNTLPQPSMRVITLWCSGDRFSPSETECQAGLSCTCGSSRPASWSGWCFWSPASSLIRGS